MIDYNDIREFNNELRNFLSYGCTEELEAAHALLWKASDLIKEALFNKIPC